MDNMERYKDFDAAVAALEPIRFKVRGHEYEITDDPDASVILKYMRLGKIADPNVAGEILESIIGEKVLRSIEENGIGVRQLSMLTDWLMGQFGFELDSAVSGNASNGSGDGPNP